MRKLLLEIISDLEKCPNQKTHESESARALSMVQNYFQKLFSHKVLYHNILKILERCGQYLKK